MAAENQTSGKKNNSLVWKLAFSQIRHIFAVCMRINFWIIILFIIGMIYWGEWQGLIAYQQTDLAVQQAETETVFFKTNTSYQIVDAVAGIPLLRVFEKSGMIAPESLRTITYSQSPLQNNYPNTYNTPLNLFPNKSPLYTVYFPEPSGKYLAVITDLGHPISIFVSVFALLLLVEASTLFSYLWKAQKSINRTLLPIYELTAATEMITSTDPLLPLSGTIDELNTITEKHLDRRISISDERAELQGLATAINSMLDRLDASYQAQLRFVSDASHELRTPISIIQGYAGLLERWGKDNPETLEESISAIKSEAIGMQALVEQLLFLARSDNHSIQMKKQVFNISEMMEEVVKETQMINNTHDIKGDIVPDLFIDADPQLIKQSVRVLVDNSIKYTPEDGRIDIKLEKEFNDVAIRIADTGIGMSDEEVNHVFERFWRADEARNRKTGGTGLGLSIAKWIVDSHQGYMQILSRKSLGTRCSIILPSVDSSASITDNEK